MKKHCSTKKHEKTKNIEEVSAEKKKQGLRIGATWIALSMENSISGGTGVEGQD